MIRILGEGGCGAKRSRRMRAGEHFQIALQFQQNRHCSPALIRPCGALPPGEGIGCVQIIRLPRKKVQTGKFGLHLLFMEVVLRQLVSNLTPPYQAARSKNT